MKNWAEITDCEIMIMSAVYNLEKAGCEVSMQKVTEYVNAEKTKAGSSRRCQLLWQGLGIRDSWI